MDPRLMQPNTPDRESRVLDQLHKAGSMVIMWMRANDVVEMSRPALREEKTDCVHCACVAPIHKGTRGNAAAPLRDKDAVGIPDTQHVNL